MAFYRTTKLVRKPDCGIQSVNSYQRADDYWDTQCVSLLNRAPNCNQKEIAKTSYLAWQSEKQPISEAHYDALKLLLRRR